jgi:putative phosphoribosyl transferase
VIFRDRTDAGRRLAELLLPMHLSDAVVLGLPRGGVPVAAEVARALAAPLDVLLVRKLGLPSHPEFARGAVGEGGVRVINTSAAREAPITEQQLAAVEELETAELHRRAERYRAGRSRAPLDGRTAILVDDGIATGSTALAACLAARQLGAARVVIATPVASAAAVHELERHADAVVPLTTPESFHAVGPFYLDFRQTSDEEVVALLAEQLSDGKA